MVKTNNEVHMEVLKGECLEAVRRIRKREGTDLDYALLYMSKRSAQAAALLERAEERIGQQERKIAELEEQAIRLRHSALVRGGCMPTTGLAIERKRRWWRF